MHFVVKLVKIFISVTLVIFLYCNYFVTVTALLVLRSGMTGNDAIPPVPLVGPKRDM